METFDVVILGAGIVGAACACECANAKLRVAVVEQGTPAGAATAAGMGHLVVMDDSDAQLALTHFSRNLWRSMRETLPDTVEFEECGTLWVAADEEEMQAVLAKQRAYAEREIDSEILDEQTLREAEPSLRAGLAGALRVPNDAVIYPPAAAAHFLASAQRMAAKLILGRRAISAEKGIVTLEDSTRLSAARVVIATGTDASLCPGVQVHPRKGHLAITDRYPGVLRHQLVELGYLKSAHSVTEDSVAFNVQPRRTGQLLIGSSRQYGELSARADPRILRRMLERAVEYMPLLANLSVTRVWTGFRAATTDKLPLIGPSADSSIILAVGFEGLGITNAPGAARLVLHHITQAEIPMDPRPFLPSRLHVREALNA
ncbi:MAG TPA: FAD-dependent oxidoreductase [Candidatus Aquilonibacter sp.]|nr:FAD-dependent oxidoreductase [Candidatus Aquilonibacter sp.]